jgi:UDP-N-acetylmuramoylalanine--D-glutamate ligase
MGLGLHGGGVTSALFFASRGAVVTVTDLKNETELRGSLDQLKGYPIRYILGRHDFENFTDTDLIIKNPAIPAGSPYLQAAQSKGIPVETDLSIFLSTTKNPMVAVTGTKGKSTTATAIHLCLSKRYPGAKLGGNITVSPLSFLEALSSEDPVVLELSSWQLADLRGKGLLKPKIAIVTRIMPDHMNRYSSMEEYISDKKLIFADQGRDSFSLFNKDDNHQKSFQGLSKARSCFFSAGPLADDEEGAFLDGQRGLIHIGGRGDAILPERVNLLGAHNRINLLAAGLALYLFGLEPALIRRSLASFSGIEHRLEFFHQSAGVRYCNDSAATIPQATVQALRSITGPVRLIAGGTDKCMDFAPLGEVLPLPRSIYLLEGTGTEKIIALLNRMGLVFEGPYDSLEKAVSRAAGEAQPGDTVLLSPGCTSFGMFQNEFDRGNQFKELVRIATKK